MALMNRKLCNSRSECKRFKSMCSRISILVCTKLVNKESLSRIKSFFGRPS